MEYVSETAKSLIEIICDELKHNKYAVYPQSVVQDVGYIIYFKKWMENDGWLKETFEEQVSNMIFACFDEKISGAIQKIKNHFNFEERNPLNSTETKEMYDAFDMEQSEIYLRLLGYLSNLSNEYTDLIDGFQTALENAQDYIKKLEENFKKSLDNDLQTLTGKFARTESFQNENFKDAEDSISRISMIIEFLQKLRKQFKTSGTDEHVLYNQVFFELYSSLFVDMMLNASAASKFEHSYANVSKYEILENNYSRCDKSLCTYRTFLHLYIGIAEDENGEKISFEVLQFIYKLVRLLQSKLEPFLHDAAGSNASFRFGDLLERATNLLHKEQSNKKDMVLLQLSSYEFEVLRELICDDVTFVASHASIFRDQILRVLDEGTRSAKRNIADFGEKEELQSLPEVTSDITTQNMQSLPGLGFELRGTVG